MNDMPSDTTDRPTTIEVSGVLDADTEGRTLLTLGDREFPLTHEGAVDYTHAVFWAANRAGFEASVLEQLAGMGMPLQAQAQMLSELRRTAPPPVTAGCEVKPGVVVGFRGGAANPVVTLHVGGVQVGQMSPQDAYAHAAAVLDTAVGVRNDVAYMRYLLAEVGLDMDEALAAVHSRAASWGQPLPAEERVVPAGGHYWAGPTNRLSPYDPQKREHLWVAPVMFRVSDAADAGGGLILDHENLMYVEGVSCYHCERPRTATLAGEPCPGDPPRRG